jgi:aconitate hydratase
LKLRLKVLTLALPVGVLAQGFARIHRRNLIAQGLVPLYIDAETRDRLEVGDRLAIHGLSGAVRSGAGEVEVTVEGEQPFRARIDLSPREREIVLAGGVLNHLSTREPGESPDAGGQPR